jgi:peroxiredoxin Q/BCP
MENLMLKLGDSVSDFCLPNQDAEEICFRDISGRWIILYFYPKDSTPGCTTEACDFNVNLTAFTGANAIVLGVSPDSPARHTKFIDKNTLNFTLLSDEEKEVCKLFGVWQLKKFMGKEYMGVVRSTFIISPDNQIVFEDRAVKVKNHAFMILEKLQELQNTQK